MANITIDTNTTWTEDKEYDDILITNNAVLTLDSHSNGDKQITVKCRNLTVDEGAKISGDGKGYLGGYYHEYGDGPGGGSGGTASYTTGAGAGYGGRGRRGKDNSLGDEGQIYGSEEKAEYQGSGGGGSGYSDYGKTYGGNGGGCFCLNIAQSLFLNGTISSDGMNGGKAKSGGINYKGAGGGSGGGIQIYAQSISGQGLISANGGDGGNIGGDGDTGGGAGGGRISLKIISFKEIPLSIDTEVIGGNGYAEKADDGTIHIEYITYDSSKDIPLQLQLPYYKDIYGISKIVFKSQEEYLNCLSLYIVKHFLNKIDLRSLKVKDVKSLLQLYFREEIKQKLDLRITHNFKETIKLLFHDLSEFSSQIQLPSYQNFKTKVRCHFPSESQYILPFTDFYIDPDDNIYKGIYLQADKNGLGYNKILMKFDLTDYTETIPQSLLHLYNFTEGWDNATVSVYRIAEDWDDSSVKNNILTDDYPITTIDISNAGEYTLDITSLINNWINGTYQNYGLLITYTDNNYLTYRNFGSTRYPLNQYHPYLSLSIYSLFTQKIKLIQPSAPLIDSWAIQTAWQSKRISWEKPKDTRLIGYNAYRSSDGGDTWEQMNSVLIPADTTYFIITGMDALVSNQWVSAITSVIKYGDQTKESDKQISRDVWGTRYLIDWPDIANSYVIYKA